MVKSIKNCEAKMKAKSKMRDAKATRFGNRAKIGIPELKGFYFGHGDERSGTRFNHAIVAKGSI